MTITKDFEPSAEERESLARKFYPQLAWHDLHDDEQAGLLAQWRMEQAAKDSATLTPRLAPPPKAAKAPATLSKEFFERIIQACDSRSKKVAQKVAELVVKRVLPEHLAELQTKLSQRLDGINERITDKVLQAVRGEKSYVSNLEAHVRELATQLRELEKKVEGR